jgi:hypothetical protein
MSPSRKSGSRLFAFMISITGRIGVPSEISFTAGSRSPSWKISRACVEIEPATIPPTSFQCAMFAVHATSSCSANTGIASTTSFRWVTPPKNGSFVKTSPGEISRAFSSMIRFTALSSTPTKDGMPAPDEARFPAPSVIPVPMSRTS